MKSRKTFSKRGRGGRGRGRTFSSRSPFSAQQLGTTASGRENFITIGTTDVAGAKSGGALAVSDVLASNVGATSGVLGYYLPLKPQSIGRRIRDLADSGYCMYRIRKLILRYRPFHNVVGNVPSGGGAVGSIPAAGVANYNFAIGWVADPAIGSLLFSEVLQAGGRVVNALRRFTMNIRPNQAWRYVEFPFTYSSTISEARQEFIGSINTAWESNTLHLATADSVNQYGIIEADWICDFKNPLDPTSDDMVTVRGSGAGISMVHDASLAREELHHQSQGPNGLAKELGAEVTGAASEESEDFSECKSISSTIHISHFDPSLKQSMPRVEPRRRLMPGPGVAKNRIVGVASPLDKESRLVGPTK